MPDIIGVQFQRTGKIYYFDSLGEKLDKDDYVIVETVRGIEYARVALGTHWMPEEDLDKSIKPLIRVATEEDANVHAQNLRAAKDAYAICQDKIAYCGLDMKLVNVEYTFDCSKVIFNFTADERVDFRELIKELAAVFHTRIELRQIGVRDEAKIIGGIGICGEPLCCHRFLTDFSPVSIKMAKEQNLSLNPTKISGCCGRLLCCLNYENAHYVESNRLAREAAKEAKRRAESGCDTCPGCAGIDTHDESNVIQRASAGPDTPASEEQPLFDISLVENTTRALENDRAMGKQRSYNSAPKENGEKKQRSEKSDKRPKNTQSKKSTKKTDRYKSGRPKKQKRQQDMTPRAEHRNDRNESKSSRPRRSSNRSKSNGANSSK